MACKTRKVIGRTVAIEFFIGCGTELPEEHQWQRLGAMRSKNFTLQWDTTDVTADDSPEAQRELLATYRSMSITGEGVVVTGGAGAQELIDLNKHVANPVATDGQPVAWVRIMFPDLTYTAFMIISNLSRVADHEYVTTSS